MRKKNENKVEQKDDKFEQKFLNGVKKTYEYDNNLNMDVTKD